MKKRKTKRELNQRGKRFFTFLSLFSLLCLAGVVGLVWKWKENNQKPIPVEHSLKEQKQSQKVPLPRQSFEVYMNQKAAQFPGNYDIAIYDVSRDKTYTWKKGMTETMYTASIIKVPILISLLRAHPTLTIDEQALVSRMIRNSDNAATEQLFFGAAGGVSAINALFDELGMSHSRTTTEWWMSETSSEDQMKLLKALFLDDRFLPQANRGYIKSEMAQVSQDQRWGVGSFSNQVSQVALKNGWRLETSWTMNSIGYVEIKGKQYLISLLSDEHPYQSEEDSLPAAQETMNQLTAVAGSYILEEK